MVCTDVAARYVRMEVEYGTVTECNEGGDGAHLHVQESSVSDVPMEIDHGQL